MYELSRNFVKDTTNMGLGKVESLRTHVFDPPFPLYGKLYCISHVQ